MVHYLETSEVAEIFETGNTDPSKLTSTQLLRYRLLMQNVTEVMLESYTQAFTTRFAPETWDTQGKSLIRRVLATAGGQWFWDQYQDNYPANFRTEVEDVLGQAEKKGNADDA